MSAPKSWDQVSKKREIHPETLAIPHNIKLFEDMTLEEARTTYDTLAEKFKNAVTFDGEMKEIIVPSRHVKEGIPVTVYKPTGSGAVPTIFIYFHGGGLVVMGRKWYESMSRTIANNTKAMVVTPEYRLLPCPDDPLAPFNDAVTVTEWVMKHKVDVGGVAESKVGVGGDSAGGQLTSSVTNNLTGLDFQLLINPVTDLTCNLPSFDEFRNIPAFNTWAMEKMFDIILPSIPDAMTNPRVNPSARKNLESCPPTLMLLAELDPLADWGIAFTKKLKAAGVKVEETMVKGVPHGFVVEIYNYPTKAAEGHENITRFIKSFQ